VGVDRAERLRAHRDRGRRLLALVEEQVLELHRPAQEHLVDGEVPQRLPLLAQRLERRHERRHVARHRAEVRRRDREVPVRELGVLTARARARELDARHRRVRRDRRDRDDLHQVA
jgi:hypothetical protein